MKIYLSIVIVLMYSSLCFGQAETVKTFVQGKLVEIVSQVPAEKADLQTVNILMDGKLVKKFSTGGVGFPQIVGTFSTLGTDYILYRTFTGNGMCGGGDIYVIKFTADLSGDKVKSIDTSPVLTACFGEFPLFSVVYNKTAQPILSISDYSMNLDYLNKWIKYKPKVKKAK